MAYTPYTLYAVGFGRDAFGRDPNTSVIWTYKTEDAMTTVRVTGYFSDAKYRGMAAGDIVHVITMSGGAPSTYYVTSVVDTTGGDGNVANGTSITLTDSD